MREYVLGFPTALLHRLGHFQGFTPEVDAYFPQLTANDACSFRPREEAEQDPTFKQLIPYCVFRHAGKLFHYRRGSGVGESRLKGKLSLGLGGHINPQDAGSLAQTSYRNGVRRELQEEIQDMAPSNSRVIGLINDDTNDVGRVHFGVVHLFEMEAEILRLREEQLEALGFVEVNKLLAQVDLFETWSSLLLSREVLS